MRKFLTLGGLLVTTQSFSKGKMSPLNIYKGDFALNQ